MSTLTLRPNGAGTYTDLPFTTGATHWGEVDEAVADDTDYVADDTVGSWLYDSYNLTTHSGEQGAITQVAVYYRARAQVLGGSTVECKPLLRLSTDSVGTGQVFDTTALYQNFNEVVARPGGGSWAWSDLDGLQGGIGFYPVGVGCEGYCSQLYVVVTYFYRRVWIVN